MISSSEEVEIHDVPQLETHKLDLHDVTMDNNDTSGSRVI